MRKLLNKKSGFTLIELMIVVAILGILAAIAIPAFVTYVRRSKTVEATENLSKMFDAVASYYSRERVGSELTATMVTSCTVPTADDTKAVTDQKQLGDYSGAAWTAGSGIGFAVSGPAYYRYEFQNRANTAGACSTNPNITVYELRAIGDLDKDGSTSTFQYAVGSNGDNELYHAPAFYIINETE